MLNSTSDKVSVLMSSPLPTSEGLERKTESELQSRLHRAVVRQAVGGALHRDALGLVHQYSDECQNHHCDLVRTRGGHGGCIEFCRLNVSSWWFLFVASVVSHPWFRREGGDGDLPPDPGTTRSVVAVRSRYTSQDGRSAINCSVNGSVDHRTVIFTLTRARYPDPTSLEVRCEELDSNDEVPLQRLSTYDGAGNFFREGWTPSTPIQLSVTIYLITKTNPRELGWCFDLGTATVLGTEVADLSVLPHRDGFMTWTDLKTKNFVEHYKSIANGLVRPGTHPRYVPV